MQKNDRPLIQVACGVLVDSLGRVLIAQRPLGKLAAGKWEFPGGKIEPGETALEALTRELFEELGITVKAAQPLLRFRHDYSNRSVVLDTWRVTAWDGELQSREGQLFAWREPSRLGDLDVLPTVRPTVRALMLPSHYIFTPSQASTSFLLERIPVLPRGALLRLRQPEVDAAEYEARARAIKPALDVAGIGLMLDRSPALSIELEAAGWHATGKALKRLLKRPLPASMLVAASVHDDDELASSERCSADFAVLGPVMKTSTHPDIDGIGWPRFIAERSKSAMPMYAIGGLLPEHLDVARSHGAAGIAAISAWWRD